LKINGGDTHGGRYGQTAADIGLYQSRMAARRQGWRKPTPQRIGRRGSDENGGTENDGPNSRTGKTGPGEKHRQRMTDFRPVPSFASPAVWPVVFWSCIFLSSIGMAADIKRT